MNIFNLNLYFELSAYEEDMLFQIILERNLIVKLNDDDDDVDKFCSQEHSYDGFATGVDTANHLRVLET